MYCLLGRRKSSVSMPSRELSSSQLLPASSGGSGAVRRPSVAGGGGGGGGGGGVVVEEEYGGMGVREKEEKITLPVFPFQVVTVLFSLIFCQH